MYLIELHNGDKAIVRRINGGTNLTRRLLQMGIIPGVEIKVIRNNNAMANRILYHPANLIMYHIERRSSFLSLFI